MTRLPLLAPAPALENRSPLPLPELLTDLQTQGLRFPTDAAAGAHLGPARRGGAGPSDHKAVRIDGQTVMVPIFTHGAADSPFEARPTPSGPEYALHRAGQRVALLEFPPTPRFYGRTTAEGIPYWKIATLHASDVLATTVLQHCVRYGNRARACQFCSIGQSLKSGATIAEKTPAQLAEVAKAAVEMDGVRHMVLTTGTPPGDDRGARVLTACSRAVRAAVDIPLQAQCEPPADLGWFARLRNAGVDTLGLHVEAVSEPVRQRIMPGKAEVPIARYLEAFATAVEVFGFGQVTTYVLAGLGDTHEQIVAFCEQVAALGVYPFVVPFVPITGTPLQHVAPPSGAFMDSLLADVTRVLSQHGLTSDAIKAGCGRCGACSTMRARETRAPASSPRKEVPAHA